MQINLHVGAHKTGTTFIQKCLAANLDTLNRSGIGYLPLLRQRVMYSSLKNVSPKRFDFGSFAASFFPSPPRREPVGIIISDENLLGSCWSLVTHGKLYPDAAERLHRLRRLLRGHEVKLFFSIRSYESFLVSAYCEVLRNRGCYIPFSDVKGRLKVESYRWPQLFAQLVEVVEPAEAVVWRFEDFPANAGAVVGKLAFDFDGPLPAPGGRDAQRPSMSAVAFDVLATIAERHGTDTAGALVKTIDEALPKGPLRPAFDPWQDEERATLKDMYAADCRDFPVPIWAFPKNAAPRRASA